MRNFRNPRFAPEGLERRLSPSGMGIAYASTAMASSSTPPPPPPPWEEDPSPNVPSGPPTGPVGPA